jgi:hypothetical protein
MVSERLVPREKLSFEAALETAAMFQEETLAGWSLYFRLVPKGIFRVLTRYGRMNHCNP